MTVLLVLLSKLTWSTNTQSYKYIAVYTCHKLKCTSAHLFQIDNHSTEVECVYLYRNIVISAHVNVGTYPVRLVCRRLLRNTLINIPVNGDIYTCKRTKLYIYVQFCLVLRTLGFGDQGLVVK